MTGDMPDSERSAEAPKFVRLIGVCTSTHTHQLFQQLLTLTVTAQLPIELTTGLTGNMTRH